MMCNEKNEAGNSCAAPTSPGSDYCRVHSGGASRITGTRRRKVYELLEAIELAPHALEELPNLLAQSLGEVRSGSFDPRAATAVSSLSAAYIRAVELCDIQHRIEVLEKQFAKIEKEKEKAESVEVPSSSVYDNLPMRTIEIQMPE